MLHNIEDQLFFQEFKLLYLDVLRSAYRIYQQTDDPTLLTALEDLQRTYQEIEPLYDPSRATHAPGPDCLLSKEDQGVGRQERLLYPTNRNHQ
jgi:hypothetical protein